MKQKRNKLLWLSIGLLVMVALVTACDIPPESNIITLEPPGISATPQSILASTPPSDFPKIPHTLEGRTSYCLAHHDVKGGIPTPDWHIGIPEYICTQCHTPAWVATDPGARQLTPTPPLDISKIPHTLEGRTGLCLVHHDVKGYVPAPDWHIRIPEDICTQCHTPAFTAIGLVTNQ